MLYKFGAGLGIEPWRTSERQQIPLSHLSLTGLKLSPDRPAVTPLRTKRKSLKQS